MAGLVGGATGPGFDYVQDAEPTDADVAEVWADTGAADGIEVYIYDGATWHLYTTTTHDELGNILSDQHHGAGQGLVDNGDTFDVGVGDGLSRSSQAIGLLAGEALGFDVDGNLDVKPGNALTVDGSDLLAVVEGDIQHDNLTGASDDAAHHIRPSAGSGMTDDSNTFNINVGDGLSKSTDAIGLLAGAGLGFDGEGNLDVKSEFVQDVVAALVAGGNAVSVSYDDGAGILTVSVNDGQIDHDSTNGGTDADAHHTKTSSASELSDVSPDSDANAHHNQNHDNSDHTTNYLPQSQYNPEADTHSRPTNTQSDGQSQSGRSDNIDIENESHGIHGYVKEFREPSGQGDVVLHAYDGGTYSYTDGNWHTINEFCTHVIYPGDFTRSYALNVERTNNHNHSI
jgi:hypothetical protein